MPLISIIIPIYNAGKYIKDCIQSIVSQTYKNFEVILIDDGSTDNSLEICKNYAKDDKRFTLISQKNGGASCARNRGLDIAKGEWVTFIDADDYIDEDYLKILCNHIEDDNSLIIQGLKQIIDGKIIKKIDLGNITLTESDIQRAFDEKEIFEYGYTVAKLYNRNVINRSGIRFNEQISYSEDLLFMLEYILNCDTIKFVNGAHYNYIMDASNLSQRYNSFESEYLLFTKYTEINQAIANKWGFAPSYKSQRCGALMLMRSLYSIYINKQFDRKTRICYLKKIKKEQHFFIRKYYSPQITLMKILKKTFLFNIHIFDILCKKKFR